jgi:FkbM family methyltransferase
MKDKKGIKASRPYGLARDLSRIDKLDMRILFDVGANTGQTLRRFRAAWPNAEVHSFEPVKLTFDVLAQQFRSDAKVHLHHCALAMSTDQVHVTAHGTSTANKVVSDKTADPSSTEAIQAYSGDEFCEARGIVRISLLKIDTEGHDLQVLRGFHRMLLQQKIDVVEVEAGMNPENVKHVPFSVFLNFLEPMGYRLFRIYDQAFERKSRPMLRRSNPAFVSGRLVESCRLV